MLRRITFIDTYRNQDIIVGSTVVFKPVLNFVKRVTIVHGLRAKTVDCFIRSFYCAVHVNDGVHSSTTNRLSIGFASQRQTTVWKIIKTGFRSFSAVTRDRWRPGRRVKTNTRGRFAVIVTTIYFPLCSFHGLAVSALVAAAVSIIKSTSTCMKPEARQWREWERKNRRDRSARNGRLGTNASCHHHTRMSSFNKH